MSAHSLTKMTSRPGSTWSGSCSLHTSSSVIPPNFLASRGSLFFFLIELFACSEVERASRLRLSNDSCARRFRPAISRYCRSRVDRPLSCDAFFLHLIIINDVILFTSVHRKARSGVSVSVPNSYLSSHKWLGRPGVTLSYTHHVLISVPH